MSLVIGFFKSIQCGKFVSIHWETWMSCFLNLFCCLIFKEIYSTVYHPSHLENSPRAPGKRGWSKWSPDPTVRWLSGMVVVAKLSQTVRWGHVFDDFVGAVAVAKLFKFKSSFKSPLFESIHVNLVYLQKCNLPTTSTELDYILVSQKPQLPTSDQMHQEDISKHILSRCSAGENVKLQQSRYS